jgi:hypothetical protein
MEISCITFACYLKQPSKLAEQKKKYSDFDVRYPVVLFMVINVINK